MKCWESSRSPPQLPPKTRVGVARGADVSLEHFLKLLCPKADITGVQILLVWLHPRLILNSFLQGGEQQQLGIGQHRTGQHRVTRAGAGCSHWGTPRTCPLWAGPAWCHWRCWRSPVEHPVPGIGDLCPSCALHGAHRALVVYITHMVVPHQRQALSLPGSGGQGRLDWGGFAWNSRAQCPAWG